MGAPPESTAPARAPTPAARALWSSARCCPFGARKPPWFKVPAPGGGRYRELRRMMDDEGLHTVCQEAACPNIGDCWQRGTATFMILGDTCTRRCGFCNVKTGKPTHNDPLEPLRVAQSVSKMGLRHAVITSVDRDDLPDLGASAFVGVIRSIRRLAPGTKVEVLTPDFRGEEMPLARVIAERPDVFNHNVETVPRLYPLARRGSKFLRSCRVLRNAKEMGGDEVVTKSGLMTGLGETEDELLQTFEVLREHDVQVLTVGQYLRPTRDHLPVVRYWHPDEFAELESAAYGMGFESVAAGPLVRSSYHAEQTLERAAAPMRRALPAFALALSSRRAWWWRLGSEPGPSCAAARPTRLGRVARAEAGHAEAHRGRGRARRAVRLRGGRLRGAQRSDGGGTRALRHPPQQLEADAPNANRGEPRRGHGSPRQAVRARRLYGAARPVQRNQPVVRLHAGHRTLAAATRLP